MDTPGFTVMKHSSMRFVHTVSDLGQMRPHKQKSIVKNNWQEDGPPDQLGPLLNRT